MTLEGTQFDHYRLLTRIGKGGMGEVYLAEDTQVRRQVAAKLIRIETVQADQQAASRALRFFRREATAIAKLDHPSILPLYDYGETEIENVHVAYLICPYCPEGSLVTWLRKRAQTQQLTFKQVAHVIQQASQGVQYAHDRAVMHLDVKPANFLISSRATADEYPELLLSDFGIARLASATSSISQHISGTPTYMAPEQWANKPVFASDQYALAIMAYELLTGSPPFQGPPMNVMFAHIHELPEPIHKRNPLLPSSVDLVLQRALAKKPEERFPSVSAFAQDFQQAFQGVPEESTLRLLRPSLPIPAMPDAPSVQAPVINDKAAPSRNTQIAHPFPVPVVAPTQEKITLPLMATASAANISDPHTSIEPEQAAIASPSVATQPPPPVAPVRPKRRRLPVLIGVLLLLIIVLVAGGGIGVWRAATAQVNRSAPVQINRSAPAQANSTPTPSLTPVLAGTITAFPAPTSASEPQGITAGSDGNLWFTEWGGNKIGRISPSGTFTEFPLPTAYSGPQEITTGPDGNLWFTELIGDKIGRISTNGTIAEFPLPRFDSEPQGITAGPDGNLWFTEGSGNKIGRISPSGAITEFPVPTSASTPVRITAGPDGNLWFTEYTGNRIGRISPSGTFTQFPAPTSASQLFGITAGPDGTLWFTEGNKIGRISPSGAITEFPLPTSDRTSEEISAGPDGNLWFTEGNKIGRISPSGAITQFPVPISAGQLFGITAGPDGNLWFTEEYDNKIGRITPGK